MNKYQIKYFYCEYCGFLQTENPFWLDEAYSNPINIEDTRYLVRNIKLSKKLTILIPLFFNKNKKYVDYGGGYGVFVRLMRDIGFDFYWLDKYCENLFARGFEYDENDNNIQAVTCFESFEHFVEPIKEIEKMLQISKNIIFTTKILPNNIPKPNSWSYYGLTHGQHISFYKKRTLKYISEIYNLNYVQCGNVHLFTEKKIPTFLFKIIYLYKIGLGNLIKISLESKTQKDNLKFRNI